MGIIPPPVVATAIKATGATSARSLADHFADTLNVRDFGAKGDGTTDDTAAINAAIAAGSGVARVVVPYTAAGYSITGLTLASNTQLTINGKLKLANGANKNILFGDHKTNIRIDGNGTLDGNKANNTGTGGNGGIYLNVCSNVRICGDLTITNCLNWPLNIVGCNNVHLDGCTYSNSGNSCEFASGSYDCWANDLTIANINDIGFCFYGGVYRCGITGSRVTGCSASGISLLNDGSGGGSNAGACSGIIIKGNTSYGNSLHGIEINTGAGSTAKHFNVTIAENIVTGNNLGNTGNSGGIILNNCEGVAVTGNVIYKNGVGSSGSVGIYLPTTVSYTTVTGNVIANEGQGGTNGIGMSLQGANSTVISGNLIYDNQTTLTMAFAMNGTLGANVQILNNFLGPTIGTRNNTVSAADTVLLEARGGNTSGMQHDRIIAKGPFIDQSRVRVTAIGAGLTIPQNTSWYAMIQTGTVASQAITFPTPRNDGQILNVSTVGAITSLTLTPQAGATIRNAPTTLAADSGITFGWDLTSSQWLRIQ